MQRLRTEQCTGYDNRRTTCSFRVLNQTSSGSNNSGLILLNTLMTLTQTLVACKQYVQYRSKRHFLQGKSSSLSIQSDIEGRSHWVRVLQSNSKPPGQCNREKANILYRSHWKCFPLLNRMHYICIQGIPESIWSTTCSCGQLNSEQV